MKKKETILIVLGVILIMGGSALANWLFNTRGETDINVADAIEQVQITSAAFEEFGTIPQENSGNGENISPSLSIASLSEGAKSIAIIMDDLDVPWQSNFNHWVIWNIPPQTTIPEAIPAGATVPSLDDAVQGIGFGEHQYRGPQPPFGSHRYQFHVFVLDDMLKLDSSSTKADLLAAMEGHIVQYGSIIGWYPQF